MSIARKRPQIVYHYCSLETFYNIITNSTIRLSNIVKSNDYEEMTYILPQVIDMCDTLLYKYNMKLSNDYILEDNFVKNLFESTFNELSLNCYVMCFSEHSDLLSQWRGYANDACGVSIGFNTDCFFPLAKNVQSNYNFSQVYYSIEKTREQIYKYIKEKVHDKWSDDDRKNSLNIMNTTHNLCLIMLYNAVFYKNPTFAEEAEWRLVYYPFGNIRGAKIKTDYVDRMSETFVTSKSGGFIRNPMSFRLSKDKIISYYDLDFTDIKRNFIKEIIIGSKADIYDLDLQLFLYKQGYDPLNIEISKSNIPYR